MITSVWQQLSACRCTPSTFQTKNTSHPSLPRLGLTYQTPVSPLPLPPTCPTFWMISLVSLPLTQTDRASDSSCAVPWQALLEPLRAYTLSKSTSTERSSYATLQSGMCLSWSIPGVATNRSLAKDPQTTPTMPHSYNPLHH